jgi:HK97 family phage prohead protease
VNKQFFNQRAVTLETREDGSQIIVGYAAVYHREGESGTEYQLWDDYYERIQPGAFDRALQEKQDVRGLFNHSSDNVLGRTTSGTMRLIADAVGLRYEIDLPDTQTARDLATSIERGDVSGSSFAFTVVSEQIERSDDGPTYRNITDVNLFDVGPVTFPAYEATTSGIRSAENVAEARAAIEAFEAAENEQLREADRVAVRLREIQLDMQG